MTVVESGTDTWPLDQRQTIAVVSTDSNGAIDSCHNTIITDIHDNLIVPDAAASLKFSKSMEISRDGVNSPYNYRLNNFLSRPTVAIDTFSDLSSSGYAVLASYADTIPILKYITLDAIKTPPSAYADSAGHATSADGLSGDGLDCVYHYADTRYWKSGGDRQTCYGSEIGYDVGTGGGRSVRIRLANLVLTADGDTTLCCNPDNKFFRLDTGNYWRSKYDGGGGWYARAIKINSDSSAKWTFTHNLDIKASDTSTHRYSGINLYPIASGGGIANIGGIQAEDEWDAIWLCADTIHVGNGNHLIQLEASNIYFGSDTGKTYAGGKHINSLRLERGGVCSYSTIDTWAANGTYANPTSITINRGHITAIS